MAVQQAGLQLVVQGSAAFGSDLAKAGTDVGKFVDTIGKGAQSFNIFGAAAEGIGNAIMGIGRAVAYYVLFQAIGAVEDFTKAIFEQAASYQLLDAELQAVSARDLVRAGTFATVNDALAAAGPIARDLILWMTKLDIASRFDLKTISDLYTLGSTYGFVQEQLEPLIGIVLDWASATGRSQEQMEMATAAFGRISQRGLFQARELNSLIFAGVPALDYLGKALNKTTGELRGMMEDGLIPANQALQIITDGMAKDYAGATARFAQTITGLTSSFSDLIKIDLREFGLGLAEGVLPYLAALVEWLQDPAIKQGFRDIGTMIGESVGNFIAWGAAIFSTEDPLRTLAYLVDDTIPGFGELYDTLVKVGPKFLELAGQAFEWGINIGGQLASGLMAAATEVLEALGYLADLISYWFSPGSPPRILPDLVVWGQEWITTLVSGFSRADLSGLTELGDTFRKAFQNLIPTGQMDQAGVIPALLGSEEGIGQAIRDMKAFGSISSQTMEMIRVAAGPAADTVLSLVEAYTAWAAAGQVLSDAQAELVSVTAAYDAQLAPLLAQSKAATNAEKDIQDTKDLTKWRTIAASDAYSQATKDKAQREIAKILLAQQIRDLQTEKDVAVDTAKAKVDAAQEATDAAQAEYDAQKARIDYQAQQNKLIQEQIDLLKQLAKTVEEVATSGGASKGQSDEARKKAEAKATQDAAAAEFKLALAKTDTAGQILLYQQRLDGLKPGTKEYYDTERTIYELQQKKIKEDEHAAKVVQDVADKEAKANQQIADASFEAELAGKSHTERLALLQEQLAKMTPGTKDYYDMLKRVRTEQEAVNKEAEAAAKKAAAGGAGKGAGAGGGSGAFGPKWGGLDLTGITDQADKAKKKIEELQAKMGELQQTFKDTQAAVEPYKFLFEGIAIVVGGLLVAAFGAWAVSVIAATWPFLALAGAVAFLKFAWDTDFGGMAAMWMDIWDGLLKPSFDMLGEALGRWLPDDTKTLGDVWEKVLKPALTAVWEFIVKYIMPALGILAAGFIILLAGAIAGFKLVWDGLFGAMQAVYTWWTSSAVPWLKGWEKWFKVDLPFAVEKFKGDWNWNVVIPLQEFWKWCTDVWFLTLTVLRIWFHQTLPDSLSDFNTALADMIDKPLRAVGDWLDKTFFGTLLVLKTWFAITLGGAFKDFKDNYVIPIGDAFNDVKGIIDDLLQKASDMVDFINSIDLPSIDISIDWPDPPQWYCDLFGCSPKPPPPHAKIFIDPVYSPPSFASARYATPISQMQAASTGKSLAANYATTNNYNYNASYQNAPRNEPKRNFDVMRTWGL